MARNKEFDDALDELKMLHDAKNLEGVFRIGIEPWRGIVIRLMDKFERVEQYCTNGELAIKSEGMEDTFKDIAVYSTLTMILFRKAQGEGECRGLEGSDLEPVDDKYNGDESYEHPVIAMRRLAEEQQEKEEQQKESPCTICPKCDQENKNWVHLWGEIECSECGAKYTHAEAIAKKQHLEAQRLKFDHLIKRRAREN